MFILPSHLLLCDPVNVCRGCWCSAHNPFASQRAHSLPLVHAAADNLYLWPSLQTCPGSRSHFTWGGQGLTETGEKASSSCLKVQLLRCHLHARAPEDQDKVRYLSTLLLSFIPLPSRYTHPRADSVFICWWFVSPLRRKIMSREQELDLSCSLPCSYCLMARSNYNNMGEMIKGWINIV